MLNNSGYADIGVVAGAGEYDMLFIGLYYNNQALSGMQCGGFFFFDENKSGQSIITDSISSQASADALPSGFFATQINTGNMNKATNNLGRWYAYKTTNISTGTWERLANTINQFRVYGIKAR